MQTATRIKRVKIIQVEVLMIFDENDLESMLKAHKEGDTKASIDWVTKLGSEVFNRVVEQAPTQA